MRVTSAVTFGSGEGPSSQKASIKRQIRKLEKKRDEYMEKLAKLGKKQSEAAEDTLTLSRSSGGQPTSPQMVFTSPEASAVFPGAGEESSAIQAALQNTSAKDAYRIQMLGSILSGEGASDSSADEFEPEMTVEELMELIEVLNVQITMLMQQLEDGSTMEMSFEPDEEDANAAQDDAQMPEAAQTTAQPLPDASVDAEGHVDGYA